MITKSYLITEFKKYVEEVEGGKIDIPELQPIYDILEKRGFIIVSSRIENNILYLKTNRLRDPDYRYSVLRDIFNKVDIVTKTFDLNFQMKKKDEEYSTMTVSLLLKPGIDDKITDNIFGKLIKYIRKYNIKNFDELVSDLTHVVRDLNRYIKINKRRDLYLVKKSFIKFLYNYDYIESIVKHTYGKDSLYLATTKINKDDEDDTDRDKITFHLIPPDLRKLGIERDSLPDGGSSPKKTYVQKDIANPEKIEEALSFLNHMNNSRLLMSAENLFNDKTLNYKLFY